MSMRSTRQVSCKSGYYILSTHHITQDVNNQAPNGNITSREILVKNMTEIPMPGDALSPPSGERPLGVMILAILQILGSLGIILTGVALFVFPFFGVVLGAIAVLIGIFFLWIGLGLWNMKGWAWTWAIIMNIIGALINLYGQGWLGLIINIVIILYLNAPDIRAVFR